jgi:glutathione S-transferase
MLKLYHHPMSTFSRKVRLALIEKGVPFERVLVDLVKGEQKKSEYLALNPNGKVPTLVDDDFVVFESTAICEYLEDKYPEPSILPGDAQARARARMWNQYTDTQVYPHFFKIFNEMFFKKPGQGDKSKIEEGKKGVLAQISILDTHLAGKLYFAGDRFSLGDIAMIPWFGYMPMLQIEPDPACQNFIAWWGRVQERKSFAESIQ